jgi:NAD(P)-dependent dehydrogenase (short-subunit alcohol dehydrogenase family)
MSNKSIFITGGASGIGRATAELFCEKGWLVGCFDLDTDALEKLQQELGENCFSGYLDVRDKSGFDAAMEIFSEHSSGRLDIMFNNAGITSGGYFDDLPYEKIVDIVNVNLMGVFNGTHAALPLLKQTRNSLLLSTASSSAIHSSPGMAVYGATKHAVKGFTQSMSVEMARYGCRASDVLPGIIDTPLWQSRRYVKGKAESTYEEVPKRNATLKDATRTISPSEVADTVWNAYHGDRVHWYVPEDLEQRALRSDSPEEKGEETESVKDAQRINEKKGGQSRNTVILSTLNRFIFSTLLSTLCFRSCNLLILRRNRSSSLLKILVSVFRPIAKQLATSAPARSPQGTKRPKPVWILPSR